MVQKTRKQFDWDKYFSKNPLESRKNATFPRNSLISLFDPEFKFFYASSLDLAFEIDNVEGLLWGMAQIKESFDSHLEYYGKKPSYFHLARYESDFENLQSCLCNICDHGWCDIEEYIPKQ